ncbi:hypothetical protein K3495_g14066 [Podosphaera aphanis]|nr:hypothetical protein K3495_g14066 [Podosphaera aphanis]
MNLDMLRLRHIYAIALEIISISLTPFAYFGKISTEKLQRALLTQSISQETLSKFGSFRTLQSYQESLMILYRHVPCLAQSKLQWVYPACYHTIHARQRNPGKILLTDVDPHWFYDGAIDVNSTQPERRILLEPAVVRDKGRPTGAADKKRLSKRRILKAAGKRRGDGSTSTLREPSDFEFVEAESKVGDLPSTSEYSQNAKISAQDVFIPLYSVAIPPRVDTSRWNVGNDFADLSSTGLGIVRGGGSDGDLYEASTARARAYMRSLMIDQLANADVEYLDSISMSVEVDSLINAKGKDIFDWEKLFIKEQLDYPKNIINV